MAVDTLRTPEIGTGEAETWESLMAVHGLWQIVRGLDISQRGGSDRLMAALRTKPYVAPEGECIVVVPHGKSREIPLHVEVFDDDAEDWHRVSPESETYESHVGFERLLDPYFVGRSIEQDVVDGKVYVYGEDHDIRVLASVNARFYRTEDTRPE